MVTISIILILIIARIYRNMPWYVMICHDSDWFWLILMIIPNITWWLYPHGHFQHLQLRSRPSQHGWPKQSRRAGQTCRQSSPGYHHVIPMIIKWSSKCHQKSWDDQILIGYSYGVWLDCSKPTNPIRFLIIVIFRKRPGTTLRSTDHHHHNNNNHHHHHPHWNGNFNGVLYFPSTKQ